MKFSISRSDLKISLTRVAFGLPRKSLNPILDNYVFEIQDGQLVISATDTMTTAFLTLDDVEYTDSSYRVILPSKKLAALAAAAPEGEIDFDIAPRKAVVTAQTSEWVLNLADASQFPSLPSLGNVSWKPVSRQPFFEAFSMVKPAISFDVGSPALCMVDISSSIFRAFDRSRLHQVESEYQVPDFSVPSYVCNDFANLLRGSSAEEFYIARGNNGFAAKIDNLKVIVAGLTAEFPDASGALLKPTLTNDIELEVSVGDLLSAVKRSRVTADFDTKVVTLKVSADTMRVSTKERAGSHTTETVQCATKSDETVVAHVNFLHLEDALNSCPSSNAIITFGKPEGSKLPSVRVISPEHRYDAVLSQIRADLL